MSSHEKDTLPPSYTESTSPSSLDRGNSLLNQLTQIRTTHIQSIISTHILPLIEQQASYGIAHTTIALLPSGIPLPTLEEKTEFHFAAADTKSVEVVGFASELEPKIVRLEGQLNRTEFWRVQAVIDELERVLRESLNANSNLRLPARLASPDVNAQRQPQRSFLSRMIPSRGPEERSASGNSEVGVRQMDSKGMVLVKARLEEICLRTVNEFGLYDTMSKQCVIVRVDARC